ncbi:unnamed protein product, partial [Ascophyllum nodosum]
MNLEREGRKEESRRSRRSGKPHRPDKVNEVIDRSLSCSEPLSEVAYLVVSSVHDQGAGVMIIASLALQEFTIKLGFVTCRACVSRELYPEEVAPDTVTRIHRRLHLNLGVFGQG